MLPHILSDLKSTFAIRCFETTPVTGGWMNQKWKAITDRGDLLIKQFSRERFRPDQLERIEAALQRQIQVQKAGVPCPAIHCHKGRAIRLLDDGTAYMIMDFCPGKTKAAGQITLSQMNSLGNACGQLHRAFSRLPAQSAYGYPLYGKPFLSSLWDNFHSRVRECPAGAPEPYRQALFAMEPILQRFSPAFFDKLPKGIAHEDFSSDNLLFTADAVSAIIDFDRNQYSFLWHDIARALLSFALDENGLDNNLIRAFLSGYSLHENLTTRNVADALRLAWCIESVWWIQPAFFTKERGKATRFRDETLWLAKHFFELDELLDVQ